jgi:hypothetical protein
MTSEEVHDGKVLKKLAKDASENNGIRCILADGAYDSKRTFSSWLTAASMLQSR